MLLEAVKRGPLMSKYQGAAYIEVPTYKISIHGPMKATAVIVSAGKRIVFTTVPVLKKQQQFLVIENQYFA